MLLRANGRRVYLRSQMSQNLDCFIQLFTRNLVRIFVDLSRVRRNRTIANG